jgi:signal transduction histidine kinase/ligand-binding sensor domain-containing protein
VFGRYQQFAWQEQHGLPQNTVLAIAATGDGYVWVGTHEGVARFDGVRFTLFNTANTSDLGNPMITGLLEDRSGALWIATFGGGLTRFAKGQFTRYTTADGLATDFISSLFEDRDGSVWIGTEGAGLNRWRDGRFMRFTIDDGLPSNLVRAIADDGEGGALLGTSDGVARIRGERINAISEPPALRQIDVFDLCRAADGALWVSDLRGGLYRASGSEVRRFGPQDGLTNDAVESLRLDSSGEMWAGTVTGGLFRYTAGRFEQYSPADGLPGGRVAAIIEGRRGERWIGTDGGLVRFDAPRFTVYTERDGLPADRVNDIYQDPGGRVWVGTENGLAWFDGRRFRVLKREDGLPPGRIRRIAPEPAGGLLVLTPGALVRWNGEHFESVEDTGVGLDRATAILRDRAGNLWVAIANEGVWRVGGGTRTHFTARDGLADDSAHNLYEDRDGHIWVATLRGGITRIADGRLTSWSTREGLADNHVRTFYEAADGALWIATHGGGVSRFKDGRFATIASRHGLYNDVVFRMLEDDDGNLWMNSNRGIWRTSLLDLNGRADGHQAAVTSFGYGMADGMLSSEGVGANLAGWKMRDGTLWFPTIRGIVVIDPRRRDSAPPQVVIEGATVDGEPVALDGPLELGPGHENLEVQYTGLSWTRPHEIRFRFRMEGLDREWVDAGTRRTAYYSHLPPGAYTFTVTADNGEGVWTTEGRSLSVRVLPPFYRTWWFRLLAGLGVLALIGAGWHYRIGQLNRSHATRQEFLRELMASQERERQRIAAELHDSLGQRLVVIKNLASLSLEPSADSEGPRRLIEEIAAETSAAIDEVRDVSYNLRPYQLDSLGLTKALEGLIKTTASASRIAFTYDIGDIDRAFRGDQEISFYRIVQESLNNIVKHSRAQAASVTIAREGRHVGLTIRDNGVGFAPGLERAGGAGGFGLVGISERAESLGGRAAIRSAPAHGTTVSVTIELQERRDGQ